MTHITHIKLTEKIFNQHVFDGVKCQDVHSVDEEEEFSQKISQLMF